MINLIFFSVDRGINLKEKNGKRLQLCATLQSIFDICLLHCKAGIYQEKLLPALFTIEILSCKKDWINEEYLLKMVQIYQDITYLLCFVFRSICLDLYKHKHCSDTSILLLKSLKGFSYTLYLHTISSIFCWTLTKITFDHSPSQLKRAWFCLITGNTQTKRWSWWGLNSTGLFTANYSVDDMYIYINLGMHMFI